MGAPRIAVLLALSLCLSATVQGAFYYAHGQACKRKTGEKGTCKPIRQCTVAWVALYQNYIKADHCFFDKDNTRVVCCPLVQDFSKTGPFREYFETAIHSVIQSDGISCFYGGAESITCWSTAKATVEQPEDPSCPPIGRPELQSEDYRHRLVWQKCVNYQRYYRKCVRDKDGSYRRVNTSPDGANRVFGGTEALSKEFPHMAVVGGLNRKSSIEGDIVWYGGGSLISDEFVLTAAHVASTPGEMARYVMLGVTNKTDFANGSLYSVVQHVVHKLYLRKEHKYDIALLKLHTRVQFSEFIHPICLPLPEIPLAKSHMIVAGWGVTESTFTSEKLLWAKVKEVERRKCADDNVAGATICASGLPHPSNPSLTQDSCQGDSGGPLMVPIDGMGPLNGIRVVYGLVSFGAGCGNTQGAVYTNTSFYVDWIIDNVWPEYAFNNLKKKNSTK